MSVPPDIVKLPLIFTVADPLVVFKVRLPPDCVKFPPMDTVNIAPEMAICNTAEPLLTILKLFLIVVRLPISETEEVWLVQSHSKLLKLCAKLATVGTVVVTPVTLQVEPSCHVAVAMAPPFMACT